MFYNRQRRHSYLGYLSPWDMAAGVLIVEEAGGTVTRFDGSPFSVYDDNVLATNGKVHQEMVGVLVGK